MSERQRLLAMAKRKLLLLSRHTPEIEELAECLQLMIEAFEHEAVVVEKKVAHV